MRSHLEQVPPNVRRWLRAREWTRHSGVVIVAGLVYIGVGVYYFSYDSSHPQAMALSQALHIAPLEAWSMAFMIVGAIAIFSAIWPPVEHYWGYVMLTCLSTLWSGFYLAGYFLSDAGSSNLVGAAIWGLAASLWWGIGGLIDPRVPLQRKG